MEFNVANILIEQYNQRSASEVHKNYIFIYNIKNYYTDFVEIPIGDRPLDNPAHIKLIMPCQETYYINPENCPKI